MKKRLARVWILMVLLMIPLHGKELKSQRMYQLSVCALFNDEAPFLEEWIEYHRLIGVDHFYLFNNRSIDASRQVLEKYEKEGIVTLVYWPTRPWNGNDIIWAIGTQMPAYECCIKLHAQYETDWLVFLDVDEFLVPAFADSLPTLLEAYKDKPGITITSECFNGSTEEKGSKLIIESFLRVQPQQDPRNPVSKTIFKPKLSNGFIFPPYQPKFKKDRLPVRISRAELRVNKYLNRDSNPEYIAHLKDKLRLDQHILSDALIAELLNDGYQIEDSERTIQRFVPSLLERMGSVHGR